MAEFLMALWRPEILPNEAHWRIKISFNWLSVFAKQLWNVKKIAKKVVKIYLWPNLILLKCFLVIHNFMDWYEILTRQRRLVSATFPISFIGNGHSEWRRNKPPMFIVIQKCRDFELWIALKHSKQFGLTWKFYYDN